MLTKERRDMNYTAIIYCKKKYIVNTEIDDIVIRLNHQVKYSEVQEVCKLYNCLNL